MYMCDPETIDLIKAVIKCGGSGGEGVDYRDKRPGWGHPGVRCHNERYIKVPQ